MQALAREADAEDQEFKLQVSQSSRVWPSEINNKSPGEDAGRTHSSYPESLGSCHSRIEILIQSSIWPLKCTLSQALFPISAPS